MLKGLDPDKIKRGNSLISSDEDKDFWEMVFLTKNSIICYPIHRFVKKWEAYYPEIKIEADKKFKGKYGPGLPRKNDGSLLFLLHMISKMQIFPRNMV